MAPRPPKTDEQIAYDEWLDSLEKSHKYLLAMFRRYCQKHPKGVACDCPEYQEKNR